MKLSKFFATFRKKSKPKPITSSVAKPATNAQSPALPKLPASAPPTALVIAKPAPQPPVVTALANTVPSPKPSEILDSVVNFIRQHLVCDDHLLNIFALWIAHTWSFPNSLKAVYLHIQSAASQSGKSTCLQLLAMLSAESWLANGPDPRTVVGRLLSEGRRIKSEKTLQFHPPYTLLLDNYQHTLGRSERQGLVAMLCSGASAATRYALGNADYCLFGPKVFAGHGPLPRSLADQCLRITLVRRKSSEAAARMHPRIRQRAVTLAAWLRQWADDAAPALLQAAATAPANPPLKLTLAEQNNTEPLLHIADHVGGPWPARARAALAAIYKDEWLSLELMALDDVRTWFFMKGDPDYLTTRDLLDLLATLENRPWSGWPKNAGGRLGALLHPFGIYSRNLVLPSGKKLKGYFLNDMKDAIERYLAPLPHKSVNDMPKLPPIGSAKPQQNSAAG